jgi:hypothetical protein
MESIVTKLLILKRKINSSKENQLSLDLHKQVNEMKKMGIIKNAGYNLPHVDTIGKTFFSSMFNKKL